MESGAVFTPKTKKTIFKKKCMIPGCTSCPTKDRNVVFHRFPTNKSVRVLVPSADGPILKDRLLLWLEKCNIKSRNDLLSSSFICSRHFTLDDYSKAGYANVKKRQQVLKKTAIPSINLLLQSSPENAHSNKQNTSATYAHTMDLSGIEVNKARSLEHQYARPPLGEFEHVYIDGGKDEDLGLKFLVDISPALDGSDIVMAPSTQGMAVESKLSTSKPFLRIPLKTLRTADVPIEETTSHMENSFKEVTIKEEVFNYQEIGNPEKDEVKDFSRLTVELKQEVNFTENAEYERRSPTENSFEDVTIKKECFNYSEDSERDEKEEFFHPAVKHEQEANLAESTEDNINPYHCDNRDKIERRDNFILHSNPPEQQGQEAQFVIEVNREEAFRIKGQANMFQCPKCLVILRSKSSLTIHCRKYHNIDPFTNMIAHKCPLCDVAFIDSISLDKHYAIHKNTKDVQTYTCHSYNLRKRFCMN